METGFKNISDSEAIEKIKDSIFNNDTMKSLGVIIPTKPIGAKVNPKYYGDFRLQFQLTDNEETNEFYNIPVSITKDVEKYIFIYED